MQVVKHLKLYTVFFCGLTGLTQNHGLVVKLSKVSQGAWVQFLLSAETLCSSYAIFAGTEPVSAL